MSTSDIYGLVLPTEADPLSIEVPAGLPDPAVLARMANEFFSALPDGGNNTVREVPSQTPTISAVDAPVTAPALRPEISLPSDPHFQSAPASAGPASVSPVSALAQETLPAVPAGVFGAPSELPAFGFLEEARPIFGDKNTMPELSYEPAKPLTDFMSAGVLSTALSWLSMTTR